MEYIPLMLPAAHIKRLNSCLRSSSPSLFHIHCLFILIVLLPFSAFASDSIKIASIYALSGPAAEANQVSVKGVRLAVHEINAEGGIAGLPIELLELDNQSTPIGSKVAADMANQADVIAIIGASFSSHSMAVAGVAQRHGIPMITNVSTSPAVTLVGDCIFRVCFNDVFQGRVMAKFARDEIRIDKVVTIYDMASDYSMGISETFEQTFTQMNGEVLEKIPYKARQPNFRNIISLIDSANPDGLFVAGHVESGRIIAAAIQNGMSAIPLGGDGWGTPRFYEIGGNFIKLGYYSTHWHQDIASAPSRRFVARYGKSGRLWASPALAYDAVHLLADAIKRAGSVNRASVQKELARTRKFEGVTGTISFDENGDPIKDVVIMKIENGVPRYLKQVDSNYLD
jgi:branched-chain amino acid transport system substrate-binding protein